MTPEWSSSAIHAQLAVKHTMEVRREEYLDYMTFERNEGPLFTELFGPIIGLKEEWAAQGATPEELDLSAFRYRRQMAGRVPVSLGWIGGDREQLIEETKEHVIYRDSRGRRMKLCKGYATLALPLDYPVETMDDWLKIKSHYEFSETRFGKDWEEVARKHLAEGRVVTVGIPGGFDEPRQLMGEENCCLAFVLEPEMISDMLNTIADTTCQVLERVCNLVQIDQLNVHEDMAGKSGPLVGPALVREFINPYYRKVWDFVRERGARIFNQDSDGDMRPILDAFLESGLNLIHPCEPAAGMDIVELREKYGTRVAFEGGIDKHVIRRSKDEIVAELEYKIPPMIRTGGCVLSLDHRIPNGTSLENYRFYVQKVWEILDRERGTV
ncbi:hypothetical protein HQ520_00855 [bacterium]|nr:hypothetical protein [bacterium]